MMLVLDGFGNMSGMRGSESVLFPFFQNRNTYTYKYRGI